MRAFPFARTAACAAVALLVLAAPALAQLDGPFSLEQIMAHPDWLGNAPEDPYWADDGKAVYFFQKRQGEEHRDLHRLDLASRQLTTVEDAARGRADVGDGVLSRDRQRKLFTRAGDLFVKDLRTGTVRQLTRTAAEESQPRFMAGEKRVSFHRGEEIFVRELDSGLEYQPAELRLEEDPDEKEEADDYLGRQQLRLFDLLRKHKADEEAARQREEQARSTDPTRVPPPFYLGDDIEIQWRELSPSGDWMLLGVAAAKRDEGKQDKMPNYVTESGYVEVRDVRVKVGTGDGSGVRLLLLDLTAHEKHELDVAGLDGIMDDPLRELREAAKARKAAADAEPDEAMGEAMDEDQAGEGKDEGENGEKNDDDEEEAKPRSIFVNGVAWSRDGRHAVVQMMSADHKDRWLALVDRQGKSLQTLHRLTDPGWINWSFNELAWLDDGRRLWFLSEESGYSQLYLHTLGADGGPGQTRRLTDGDYVVGNVEIGPEQRYAYFSANPEHPGTYEVFRVPLAGGAVEQLTDLGGRNEAVVSPSGNRLLVSHETTTRPPELYLQAARPGSEATQLTHTVSETFTALPWQAPEIVAVPSSHQSRPIYARVYEPTAEREPGGGPRPAVLFVHGAGYLQNAHAGWSGYFREYMFHNFLAQNGYVVLDMDYRASAGYGREWRTAIYRQMGTPEVEDLADGVDWLVEHRNVDRERVGVYGGSYGGFLAFMALFTQPDLFACGAALRPVTDWAHYNHPYTSNILNTPEVDPEAYARSSPIELAAGLEKPLLICTGMQDDNVFFQDTVRLVQRLIELRKEDWEVAIYPLEPHGFREPESWLDEYRRIFKLFERYLAHVCP